MDYSYTSHVSGGPEVRCRICGAKIGVFKRRWKTTTKIDDDFFTTWECEDCHEAAEKKNHPAGGTTG